MIYFFSDVHLGLKSAEIEKQKEKKLVSFLDHISADAQKVFIVGDLFDCWIEYRKVVPRGYFRLLAKLNEMSESGIELNFLSGNHDFWLNTYLRDEVGLKIHYNNLIAELNGKKFFIIHGDGLAKNDLGYRIIKKILRNKVNQFLYSLIHPDIGITLAQISSRKSRDYSDSPREQKGLECMKDFAQKKIADGFDYVVMGHLHKPQCISISAENKNLKGYFVTLGDWIKHDTYATFSGGNFDLKKWTG